MLLFSRVALALAILFTFTFAAFNTAEAAPVTLRFTELSPRPANGVSIMGVTFGFTLGGLPSTDATYGGRGPRIGAFVQDPSLEGNAAGVLTLNFAAPTPLLSFGVARSTATTLTPGLTVALFDPTLTSIGNFSVNTSVVPGFFFSEGQFNYPGGALISRAVLTFPNPAAASRFAIDNVTFEPIPEPTTILLLGTGLAGVGAAVRKRRRKVEV